MSVDEFVKTMVIQLPNFAGLLVAVYVEFRIILMLWQQNIKLQNRICELCGDTTPDETEISPTQ